LINAISAAWSYLKNKMVSVRRSGMTTNEGIIDRAVRIVVGLALIAVALGFFGPSYTSVWGWIGILPLVTGVVGWCPAYSLLGIKTCAA
jgi:hypothetical protein